MNDLQTPTIIFPHIPKTAGTTLNIILEGFYPSEKMYTTFSSWHHPRGSMTDFLGMPVEARDHFDYITGHFGFGLHRQLTRPAVYITLFRNPLERVISHYYFEKSNPATPVHALIGDGMTIGDYVNYYTDAARMDNLQTRFFAGDWDKHGDQMGVEACDETMLLKAKQQIEAFFPIIGLTERFEDSFLLMRREFDWPAAYFPRYNVTRNRPRLRDLTADEQQLLSKHNRFDLDLYAYLSERLDRQIAEAGPSFQREKQWFQLINRPLGLLARLKRQIPLKTHLRRLMGNNR